LVLFVLRCDRVCILLNVKQDGCGGLICCVDHISSDKMEKELIFRLFLRV